MGELRTAVTIAIFLAAMVICAWLGLRQRVGIVLLVLLSLIWLTVDKLWEGPRIVPIGAGHGVVAADIVGVAGLVVAALLGFARLARRADPTRDDVER